MHTRRGIAGKPLTILILVLAIAFTIAAFLVRTPPQTQPVPQIHIGENYE